MQFCLWISLIVLCCTINVHNTNDLSSEDESDRNIRSIPPYDWEHGYQPDNWNYYHENNNYDHACSFGYIHLSIGCQPICDFGCKNVKCSSPNICTCNTGYVPMENNQNE